MLTKDTHGKECVHSDVPLLGHEHPLLLDILARPEVVKERLMLPPLPLFFDHCLCHQRVHVLCVIFAASRVDAAVETVCSDGAADHHKGDADDEREPHGCGETGDEAGDEERWE